jgi:hypothetical protein
MSGHWLDRLAVRATTRRDTLKAAAAGTAILSLPGLLRPARAAAASGCTKGCTYQARKNYYKKSRDCGYTYGNSANSKLIATINWPGLAVFTLPSAFLDIALGYQCKDQAVLHFKASAYDCQQPGCGTFDPYGPGGPCEGCLAVGVFCCECQTVAEGYMCCVYACNDKDHSCCAK